MKTILSVVCLLLAAVIALQYRQHTGNAPSPYADVRVCFILAGHKDPIQHYSNRVLQGALDAEADLGCKVEVRSTDWDRDMILAILDTAITIDLPDTICIPGFPRQDDLIPFVDEAFRKGIHVTSYSVPIPSLEAEYGNRGFGRVGGDGFYFGQLLATRMIEKYDLESGMRVLLVGSISEKGRGRVGEGGLDVFTEAGMSIDYIDLDLERQGDPPRYAKQVVEDYLRERDDFDAIFFEASSVNFLVDALEAAQVPPGRYVIGGIGVNADTLEDVKRGYVGLLASGDPYLSGYMPVLQACLTKRYKLGGMQIDSPVYFVDEENVEHYIELVERGVL